MRSSACLLALSLAACSGPPGEGVATDTGSVEPSTATTAGPEATSLLGSPLYAARLTSERLAELNANIESARASYEAEPNEDTLIWFGRRVAYAGRFNDAVAIYSDGLQEYPDSYRLRRHRGHRYISLRRFDEAIVDLEAAARLATSFDDATEPDGIPNRLNTPLSTDKFNIWYHLALAHYLRGDFEAALEAYHSCLEVSLNPDLLVATSDWMYMTLRRLGRDVAAAELLAPITSDLAVVENDAYKRRLLMYKGEVDPGELLDLRAVEDPDVALNIATQGYGVGNWYLYNGDENGALEVFERILEGTSWAAFGYIAAEAEVQRMRPQG